jgi:hypothetical protein
MVNPALIFKIFTRRAILNSVPGLADRFRRKPTMAEEMYYEGGYETSGMEQMPIVESDHVAEALSPPEVGQKPESKPAPPTIQKIADIDFGSITPLVQNPAVNMIECPGPGKNIIVRTYNVRKPSNMQLSAEQMKDIVTQFSKKARVPLINGLFRAWIDKFLVSSIIAQGQPINFIVQKALYPHFA